MNLTENLSDGNDVGCLGDDYCPPQCTCTGTIVRCSHAKLQEIPKVRPVQYSTAQYSTLYSTVEYSTVKYDTVQYGMALLSELDRSYQIICIMSDNVRVSQPRPPSCTWTSTRSPPSTPRDFTTSRPSPDCEYL